MKKHISSYLLFITLALACIISSCTKEITVIQKTTPVNDTTAKGPVSGPVAGIVRCYTETGKNLPLSGVKVSIENTNISAISDASGNFILPGVTEGVYTIVYSKDSFGTKKTFNFPYPSGGLNPVFMIKKPVEVFSALVDSLVYTLATPPDTLFYLLGSCNISNVDTKYEMLALIAFGLTPDFDVNDAFKLPTATGYCLAGNNTFKLQVDLSELLFYLKSNFPAYHGKKIYVKVYPFPYITSGYDGFDYTDPINGIQYTAIGTPVAGQFIFR